MIRQGAALTVLLLASLGWTQDRAGIEHDAAHFGPSIGMKIAGSSSARQGWVFAWERAQEEGRLKLGGNRGQFVWQGQLMRTSGPDGQGGTNDLNTLGVTALARYWSPGDGPNFYWEAGFGVTWLDRQTADVESNFVTTPTLGIGLEFDAGNLDLMVGLRWMHYSNANTNRPNRGMNQLQLTLGTRL